MAAPERIDSPLANVDHAALVELAEALGVATHYWSQDGVYVDVAASTLSAVTAALGADPTSTESIARSLTEITLRPWRRVLPPVFVMIQGQQQRLPVHVLHGESVRVELRCEDGTALQLMQLDHWVDPREVDGQLIGEASFLLPIDLPLGWHVLTATTDTESTQAPLVVTPQRLRVRALTECDRMWGFMVQLYSVQSRRSWSIGDITDARDLATWSSTSLGADFLLLNPLHAASFISPMDPSPYLPSSRRFANPIYLRVEDIPEASYLKPKQYKRIRQLAKKARALEGDLIDRDAIWSLKRAALRQIHKVPLSPGRQASFDSYVAQQGAGLVDFATWSALAAAYGARWSRWPKEYRDPQSMAVAHWRASHADQVRWHLWLQWLLDEQLASAQAAAKRSGMSIGIVHDLAVGVAHDGADAWSLQRVLAKDVAVGAPPDMYNQQGQNWAQPPWRPDALAEAAFVPYRDMLRTILRNAGGIRIDHVLGLFRMWWVPEGHSADQGTYVRFDHEALIGILALEVERAGALVIGEDLGTVEPWVQDVLRDRGLLGTSILWFERDANGQIIDPQHWRRDVLASVTVHDLPPTAGYLADEHVRLRHELGLLSGDVAGEMAKAENERNEWLALLRQRGYLGEQETHVDDIVVALHRLLASTPARLLGVSLPDVVGDTRAQNQPGTHLEYPNWRVPMTDATGAPVALEDLARYRLTEAVVAAVTGNV